MEFILLIQRICRFDSYERIIRTGFYKVFYLSSITSKKELISSFSILLLSYIVLVLILACFVRLNHMDFESY